MSKVKMIGSARKRLGGAVYILPNLLTTGNLLFGFFSVINSIQGNFSVAAYSILVATIFDILDGRVARLTNGTSEFGVQYDSLCDLCSFGIAPAIMMYQYALYGLDRIGWIICFLFVACGALRLARFNVQSSIGKNTEDFIGLPIPMAAGLVACFIGLTSKKLGAMSSDPWLVQKILVFLQPKQAHLWILGVFSQICSFLMVSNVPYRSHKSIKIEKAKTFRLLALLVAVLAMIAYRPVFASFIFFSRIFYWGFLSGLWGGESRLRKMRYSSRWMI